MTVASAPGDRPDSGRPGCPELSPYYPGGNPDWQMLSDRLASLIERCLRSSEFFALYGAAQLNSGQVAAAVESLERALLLDPDNGAAQVDYAQALFLRGELFPALDLNRQLLSRKDMPVGLSTAVEQRHAEWEALTTDSAIRAELLIGHDSNLNRGPSADEITLTVSGDPIGLALGDDFLPVAGMYSNLRLAAVGTVRRPGHDHNWLLEARGRHSKDTASDSSQLTGRYVWSDPGDRGSWQLGAGITHLGIGGKSLFTATEANIHHQWQAFPACNPYAAATVQHQWYHRRASSLDALETQLTGGFRCGGGRDYLLFDVSHLDTQALRAERPGGNRQGWQVRFAWEVALAHGTVTGDISHTQLFDREGYSPLLENGARRDLKRTHAAMRYQTRLGRDSMLLLNLYHQDQKSNLAVFSSRETAFEVGLRWNF